MTKSSINTDTTCVIRCSKCKQLGWVVAPLGGPVKDGTHGCLFKCMNPQSDHYEHILGVYHKICVNLVRYK